MPAAVPHGTSHQQRSAGFDRGACGQRGGAGAAQRLLLSWERRRLGRKGRRESPSRDCGGQEGGGGGDGNEWERRQKAAEERPVNGWPPLSTVTSVLALEPRSVVP